MDVDRNVCNFSIEQIKLERKSLHLRLAGCEEVALCLKSSATEDNKFQLFDTLISFSKNVVSSSSKYLCQNRKIR